MSDTLHEKNNFFFVFVSRIRDSLNWGIQLFGIFCAVSFGDKSQPVSHWIFGVEHLGGTSGWKSKRSLTGAKKRLDSMIPAFERNVFPCQLFRSCIVLIPDWGFNFWGSASSANLGFLEEANNLLFFFRKLYRQIWNSKRWGLPHPLLNWNLLHSVPLVKNQLQVPPSRLGPFLGSLYILFSGQLHLFCAEWIDKDESYIH